MLWSSYPRGGFFWGFRKFPLLQGTINWSTQRPTVITGLVNTSVRDYQFGVAENMGHRNTGIQWIRCIYDSRARMFSFVHSLSIRRQREQQFCRICRTDSFPRLVNCELCSFPYFHQILLSRESSSWTKGRRACRLCWRTRHAPRCRDSSRSTSWRGVSTRMVLLVLVCTAWSFRNALICLWSSLHQPLGWCLSLTPTISCDVSPRFYSPPHSPSLSLPFPCPPKQKQNNTPKQRTSHSRIGPKVVFVWLNFPPNTFTS